MAKEGWGSYNKFMLSYGLKPYNDEDHAVAKQILDAMLEHDREAHRQDQDQDRDQNHDAPPEETVGFVRCLSPPGQQRGDDFDSRHGREGYVGDNHGDYVPNFGHDSAGHYYNDGLLQANQHSAGGVDGYVGKHDDGGGYDVGGHDEGGYDMGGYDEGGYDDYGYGGDDDYGYDDDY